MEKVIRGRLAGAYMKGQEPGLAIPVYESLLKREPNATTAWRGPLMAQALSSSGPAALTTAQHFPAGISRTLGRDPDYLRAVPTAYQDTGQAQQAEQILLDAIDLRGGTATSQRNLRLQYALLLASDQQYAEAGAVYRELIEGDPENVSAWQGLVALEHESGQDPEAVTLVERMPPQTYDDALRDGGFPSLLASIYEGQNHPDVAQQFLERAARIYADHGQELPISLQLQVAAVDLQRNRAEGAYRIYRSVLTQHPDRLDAWKGLLAALHQTGHDGTVWRRYRRFPPGAARARARCPVLADNRCHLRRNRQ